MKKTNTWTIPKVKAYPKDSNKEWYVWFRFNGILKIVKLGLNKIVNHEERLKEVQAMADVLHERLQKGWISENSARISNKSISITDAIIYGFEQKNCQCKKIRLIISEPL